MKKYKLKNKKRFYTIVGMTVFIISMIFMTAFYQPKAQGETLTSYKTVTVDYGDTLWNIAQEFKGDSSQDLRMFVYNIEKANGLDGEMITPGQVLRIPLNDN